MVLQKVIPVFAMLLLLLLFANNLQVNAAHTDVFIPRLEMEPKSPVAGQMVTLTTVLTNSANFDMSNVQVSFGIDGIWIIDDVRVDLPARRSVQLQFSTVMPVEPGGHQLKACPDRENLGDDGDQCRTLDFVAADESSLVVAIVSPREEAVLSDNVTIKVVAFGQNVEKVELYLQNKLVDTKNQVPFDFTLDTAKYENGQYTIYAIAYFDSGISRISSIKKFFIDNGGGNVFLSMKLGEFRKAEAKVGQSVVIESDVTNGQPFKIAATLIVLVKDPDGYTEFLSWKEERIPVGETFPLSQTWVPGVRGNYTVEVFLWDTIENAVPLSEMMKASVTVN